MCFLKIQQKLSWKKNLQFSAQRRFWLTIIGTEYKYTCAQLQYEYKLTMNSGFWTFKFRIFLYMGILLH
jgi:hypothetical protein